MPKILLTTAVPGWSLEEIFSFANEVKFDGVEYVIKLPDLIKEPKYAAELSKHYNLPVRSVHQPLLSIIYTPPFLYKPLIQITKTLGAKVFVAHASGFLNPVENRTAKFHTLLEREGIKCCFESSNSQMLFRFYPKATYKPWVFSNFCQKNNLPMTLDTSHVSCFGVDIIEFFNKNHKVIKHIHLSDYTDGSEHLVLGEGKLPIKMFLQTLKKYSYTAVTSPPCVIDDNYTAVTSPPCVIDDNYKDFITFEIRQSNKNSSKQYLKEKIRENLLFLRNIISS